MLASIAGNRVDPLIQRTPYGAAAQGALDFRQPVMDAIMGVDDEKAIMDMLSYFLAGRMQKPVSGRQLPVMPRNSASRVNPAQTRFQELYQAL
jgi:hypothetical protein